MGDRVSFLYFQVIYKFNVHLFLMRISFLYATDHGKIRDKRQNEHMKSNLFPKMLKIGINEDNNENIRING